MKLFLRVLSALIIVGALIDTNVELVKSLGFPDWAVNWVKLIGIFVTAFMPSLIPIKDNTASRPEDDGKDKDGAVVPTKGF